MTAYMKALENKWIKDYKWFERQLKPVGYWTFENVFNAVKDCKNITEVRIKHRYLYKIIKKNSTYLRNRLFIFFSFWKYWK